jgi:hypothetical protein
MNNLNGFMSEYECEDITAAIYALEDGEFLSTTDLTQEQVEALWLEANQRVKEALSYILREIHTANKLRGEGNAIANDPDNEVLLGIFHNAMNKFDIELVDDEDALAYLFGATGLDAIRGAEAGIGGVS